MSSTTTATAETIGTTALAAIPVAGPALAAAAKVLTSIFAASHAAAVAKEASTINSALPTFVDDVVAVMTDANSGAITAAEAVSYLTQAQTNYETTVADIIQDDGTCFLGCALNSGSDYTWSAAGAAEFNGSSQPGGQVALGKGTATAGETTHCCNSGATCNAACCLRCGIVVPTVLNLTAILNAGAGTWEIPASAANGSIQGTSAVTIEYSAPTVLTGIEGLTTGKVTVSEVKSLITGQSTSLKWIEVAGLTLGVILLFVAIARK
jgi:hypothetical protein